MTKLSIIVPSRDEKFLTPTIDDIFRNCRDEQTEVIAVLDSNTWPGDWKEVADRHPRLHTIHNGSPIGMRGSINKGVASAISRGAKFIAKFDAHCSFSEGFDTTLMAECDEDWIVVPRRGRLDPESWTATDTHKPDIDYHYLSFPDDPNDFGGPGLNGKPWGERAIERKDILIDDEMSSQGSGWFMHASFFQRLGFMDESRYGPFWNEFQELGMCAWLSGGAVKVNKKCRYLHLHKGSKHGRGYRLPESWLKSGRDHTMKWIWNEAWDSRQARPFSWLIEHFWPVPSWPENWEELLYATRKPRALIAPFRKLKDSDMVRVTPDSGGMEIHIHPGKLKIHFAAYGIGDHPANDIDVTDRITELVKDGTLDVIVNNSTLTPGQNPFRGKRKRLLMRYSFDSGEAITIERVEKDWLIIGPVQQQSGLPYVSGTLSSEETARLVSKRDGRENDVRPAQLAEMDDQAQKMDALMTVLAGDEDEGAKKLVEEAFGKEGARTMLSVFESQSGARKITQLAPDALPTTAPALNDYLIRKFSISPQRLRGPMPIEVPQFHRNDLAQLFAELGFKRGAEIGVAEGNYSEVLLKASPQLELHLIDPWERYSGNPQNKTEEKHGFAYQETLRKTKPYPNVRIYPDTSMAAMETVRYDYLDFAYVDGNHLFDYVMQDLIEWSKRVRSGGIVSGDDYYALDQKRWTGGGVVEAVQAYTKAHRIPIWWLFAGHKSVDFMWVKP